MNGFIRFLLYANEFDIEGFVYSSSQWQEIHAKVSDKAVVYIILDQDVTFKKYILPNWPGIKTIYNHSQPKGFAYNHK